MTSMNKTIVQLKDYVDSKYSFIRTETYIAVQWFRINITEKAYLYRVYRAGYQTRVAIAVAMCNELLMLTNSERQSMTLGKSFNLMQVDAAKIETFIPQNYIFPHPYLTISNPYQRLMMITLIHPNNKSIKITPAA